jgi:hypothetical protein
MCYFVAARDEPANRSVVNRGSILRIGLDGSVDIGEPVLARQVIERVVGVRDTVAVDVRRIGELVIGVVNVGRRLAIGLGDLGREAAGAGDVRGAIARWTCRLMPVPGRAGSLSPAANRFTWTRR